MTLSGFETTAASLVIEIEDVLLANITSLFVISSSDLKSLLFDSKFSGIASITNWQSLKTLKSLVKLKFETI
jgi:hypothetical protein